VNPQERPKGSSRSSAPKATWDSSAREYDRFEKKWHYYARVAEGLVRPLGIRRDSRVLELAGGTGACTLVIARRCPLGELVSVERSAEMIRIAQANAKSAGISNVTLLHGDVSDLSSLLAGKTGFEFAVCNSAFWQFPEPGAVIDTVRESLGPGGLFAFNIPSWFRSEKEVRESRRKIAAILTRHGVDPSTFWPRRRHVDYPSQLVKCGMGVIKDTKYRIEMDVKEAEEWRRIPVFAERWGSFRGVSAATAKKIRNEVRRLDLNPRPANSRLRRSWRLLIAGVARTDGGQTQRRRRS